MADNATGQRNSIDTDQLPTMLRVEAVTNWFVDKASSENQGITIMKLQKLVFLAHGWHLSITGTPLVSEQVSAMEWGPCFPTIQSLGGLFGSGPLRSRDIRDVSWFVNHTVSSKDSRIALLERIWSIHGWHSTVQLAKIVNSYGGPYQRTMAENPGRSGTTIPDAYIKEYFGARRSAGKVKFLKDERVGEIVEGGEGEL